jgi:hypothetical protein
MRKAAILILVGLSIACFSEPVGIRTTRGEWLLEKVNGQPLPFVLSGSGANKTELISDRLFLYEGFTYDETVEIRTTVNGQATTTKTTKPGPYGLSQGAMVFMFNDGTPSKTATVEGNKMTFGEPDFVRIFTKTIGR